MDWISHFDLVLFDLDGLLVNTELLHFHAYQRMCAARGFLLPWDFACYCQQAHRGVDNLRIGIYAALPALQRQQGCWQVLYAEKRRAMSELLLEKGSTLMEGVAQLLQALAEKGITRCVVTHSPDELVQTIRQQNALLETIPHWITRHDYTNPKPDPECYRKAIEMYGTDCRRIIGFEDSPRGLTALMGTKALPVLITDIEYPETASYKAQGAIHFSSFNAIPADFNWKSP